MVFGKLCPRGFARGPAVRFGGSHDVCGFVLSRLACEVASANPTLALVVGYFWLPVSRTALVYSTPTSLESPTLRLNEDGDELVFAVRGSFSSVEISVRADGTWKCGPEEMTSDIKNFNVPITDIFDGNGEVYDGTVVKTYAESSHRRMGTKLNYRSTLDTRASKRRWCPIHHLCLNQHQQVKVAASTIEGLRLQAFVGLFADGEKEMDDGKHSYAQSTNMRLYRPANVTLTITSPDGGITVNADMLSRWTVLWQSGRDYSGAKSSPVRLWINRYGCRR